MADSNMFIRVSQYIQGEEVLLGDERVSKSSPPEKIKSQMIDNLRNGRTLFVTDREGKTTATSIFNGPIFFEILEGTPEVSDK